SFLRAALRQKGGKAMRWYRKVIGLATCIVLVYTAPLLSQELRAIGQMRSAGPVSSEGSQKIVSVLRSLLADFRTSGITRELSATIGIARSFSSDLLKVDDAARVQVYVYVTDTTEQTLDILRRHELDIEIVNQALAIVQGWIPVEDLE